jgi:hypothetical protein
MGLNPSFSRFIKNVMRDSSKMSYVENFLSSSSSLKKIGTRHSWWGEFEESGSILFFLESIMAGIFFHP